MSWVKIDDQFADHPKVLQAGPLAAWLYVCGLTYCGRYLTDGWIPRAQVRKLADVDSAFELADRLVSVGLWEEDAEGYRVHDYLEYNPTAKKVKTEREANAQRQAEWRDKHRNEDGTFGQDDAARNGVSNGVTSGAVTPAPSPSPSPSPDPVPVPASEDSGASAPSPSLHPPREVPKGLTAGGREYFSQFHRSRWATNEQRRQFEDAERDVGSTIMIQAVKWAAANNIPAVPKICSAAAKMKRDAGKPRASPGNGHAQFTDPSVYEAAGKEWADGK